jgi:hypothetical protein
VFDNILFVLSMSTSKSIVNKIAVCLCCSTTACGTGQCYDIWTAVEAYGFCALNCQACCWALCAPICHECKMGDTKEAGERLKKALKYCAFCCLLDCVAPCDGCINCVLYTRDNCKEGVSSYKDVMKNTMFIGSKIQKSLDLPLSSEPANTYNSFTP